MPFPEIKGGTGNIAGVYDNEGHEALLVTDAESTGPIQYLHMLVVRRTGSSKVVLIVTSEINTMQNILLEMAAENDPELRKELSNYSKQLAVLGVFDKEGTHHLLDYSEGWSGLEKFRAKALSAASNELGLQGDWKSAEAEFLERRSRPTRPKKILGALSRFIFRHSP